MLSRQPAPPIIDMGAESGSHAGCDISILLHCSDGVILGSVIYHPMEIVPLIADGVCRYRPHLSLCTFTSKITIFLEHKSYKLGYFGRSVLGAIQFLFVHTSHLVCLPAQYLIRKYPTLTATQKESTSVVYFNRCCNGIFVSASRQVIIQQYSHT